MSLSDIWKKTPEQLEGKLVHQVLAFAGDGKLRDDNETSKDFRSLLAHVPSQTLVDYSNQCLTDSFKDSGLVLQDIANQVGHRLGFSVTPGRYRGTSKEEDVGFDGLWIGPDGDAIVIEVKTTDAYRLSLDTAANYRKALIKKGEIKEENSSVLYVVGRNDTGDLEAQVRGSRHAWEIRIISIDALLRLMKLKEELEDQAIMGKIRDVLMPQEFTRVDGIIELVFSAAEEVKQEESEFELEPDSTEPEEGKKKFTPVAFRQACIDRISRLMDETLVKRTAAIFATPDEETAVYCAISRTYEKASGAGYWFAFHPEQKETLEKYPISFVCFGCGSEKQILKFPAGDFYQWLEFFNKTESEERYYWHVHIHREGEAWRIHTKQEFEPIDVTSSLLLDPA